MTFDASRRRVEGGRGGGAGTSAGGVEAWIKVYLSGSGLLARRV